MAGTTSPPPPELDWPNLNFLDPKVRHDPTINSTHVAKLNSDVTTDGGLGTNTSDFDMKKVDGVAIPIIRVANQVIDTKDIKYVYIDYKGFVPEIVVTVYQHNHSGEMIDVPGMYADMTVIMTPQVNGAYKKITLDFYVREIEYHSNDIVYYGTYKLMKMDQPLTKQIIFPESGDPKGCQAKYCKLPLNMHPTTYEFLHEIAVTELGLGFAATDQVKEIKDDKVRLLHGEKLYDAIQKHVRYGGLDKDSIFDCWIDLYRYLVVVNLPYVLNEEIQPNQIGIKPTIGIDPTASNVCEDKELGTGYRVITNFKNLPDYINITFSNYRFEVDNKSIQDSGANNSVVISNPVGAGSGNNACTQTDIKITEGSLDGTKRACDYNFGTQECLGPEFGSSDDGCTPVLMQEKIHDSYLRKLRARYLVVEMDSPNLGLQRGTVINVVIFEYNTVNKRFMAGNYKNAGVDDEVNTIDDLEAKADPDSYTDSIDTETARNIQDDTVGILNHTISGMYYIDGMTFEYSDKYQKFIQKLWLIKKGAIMNYSNATSMTKITDRNS